MLLLVCLFACAVVVVALVDTICILHNLKIKCVIANLEKKCAQKHEFIDFTYSVHICFHQSQRERDSESEPEEDKKVKKGSRDFHAVRIYM